MTVADMVRRGYMPLRLRRWDSRGMNTYLRMRATASRRRPYGAPIRVDALARRPGAARPVWGYYLKSASAGYRLGWHRPTP